MTIDRRHLLSALPAAALWPVMARAATMPFDLIAFERRRVTALAEAALGRDIVTLTAFTATRSPGGRNDYYSEGDYWWPDPAHPGGPYIRRDGFSNPDKFDAHRLAVIRLSLDVPARVAGWKVTGRAEFAARAAAHLKAWFVEPTTRMTPNLEHAQAIIGVNTGRGIGIIDTLHLVEVARAVETLKTADSSLFPDADKAAVTAWFRDYLNWMRTSANGQDERGQTNNHGSAWWLQAVQFARLSDDSAFFAEAADWVKTKIVPQQIAPDGKLPLELARTKPYAYSLFDLEVLCALFHCLAQSGQPLWGFETADGRSLAKAEAFMVPFIRDKKLWPYPPDVENFADFPIRQNSLLFSGVALNKPDYLALWRSLPSDSTVPEVIRNFPIRQPVLWF